MSKKLLPLLLALVPVAALADPLTTAIASWASSISFGSVISSVASGLATVFVGSALGKLFGLNKRPSGDGATRPDIGQLQTVFAGDAWIPHVYGQTRTGAIVVDQFVTNDAGQVSDVGDYAYAVYAISVGEIESISQVYFYDMALLEVTPTFNTVYSGTSIKEKFRNQITVEFKSGSAGQTLSTILDGVTGQNPGDTTKRYQASDVGSGIAYMVLKIKRDRENGIIGEATPTAITLDIKGRKVRDIRQQGSPYVWSSNPALICLEEMRDTVFGAGIPNENIDFYAFAEWADVCEDEAFTIHGRLPQGFTTAEVITICETHSDTDVIDANGVITAKPNVQVVSSNSITLNDSNIIQGLAREEVATTNIFTSARVGYVTSQGISALTIRQFDDATIDKYGFRTAELNYRMCADKEMAEKLSARALVQQTLPQITGILNREGYEIGVGDICTVNFSYGDILPAGSKIKIVGVTKERMYSNQPVKFTAKLYDDDVFTQQLNSVVVPAILDGTAAGTNDVPTPIVTNAPIVVAADNKITLEISNSRADFTLDWQIKDDSDVVWSSYNGPTNSSSPVDFGLPPRAFRGKVRIRFVNPQGVKGLWWTSDTFNNDGKVPALVNTAGEVYTVAKDGTPSTLALVATSIGTSLASSLLSDFLKSIVDSDAAGIFDWLLGNDSDIEKVTNNTNDIDSDLLAAKRKIADLDSDLKVVSQNTGNTGGDINCGDSVEFDSYEYRSQQTQQGHIWATNGVTKTPVAGYSKTINVGSGSSGTISFDMFFMNDSEAPPCFAVIPLTTQADKDQLWNGLTGEYLYASSWTKNQRFYSTLPYTQITAPAKGSATDGGSTNNKPFTKRLYYGIFNVDLTTLQYTFYVDLTLAA